MMSCRKAFLAALLAIATAFAQSAAALAGPTLLLEEASGRVLYAEGQDDEWYPASLTKIMTAYVAFEALKTGRLKLDEMIAVSEKATQQAPSKLGLPAGTEIPAELVIRSVIVKSANDAAVMLAEHIAGSEEAFVRLMNDTARRLGMTRTRFANAHGLPVPGQVSTARDLARLARAVLRDFPQHQPLWGQSEVQVGRQKLKSHNLLLRSFDGADGIKTGFICDSGFNVIASARRDGRRLIAVVLGEPSGRDRSLQAAALLDHGFETHDWKVAAGAPTIETLPNDPAAAAVVSVRKSVVSWACNPPPRKVAKRKPGKSKGKKTASPARAASARPAGAEAIATGATATTTGTAPAKAMRAATGPAPQATSKKAAP